MNTTAIGLQAEQTATDYLMRQGFTVLARNWRTRYCEIDIVAQKDDVVYIVEVKYRRHTRYGGGFAAITEKKVRQLVLAARFWEASNNNYGAMSRIIAIELTGLPPAVIAMVDLY